MRPTSLFFAPRVIRFGSPEATATTSPRMRAESCGASSLLAGDPVVVAIRVKTSFAELEPLSDPSAIPSTYPGIEQEIR
jgi:hypothetical protein